MNLRRFSPNRNKGKLTHWNNTTAILNRGKPLRKRMNIVAALHLINMPYTRYRRQIDKLHVTMNQMIRRNTAWQGKYTRNQTIKEPPRWLGTRTSDRRAILFQRQNISWSWHTSFIGCWPGHELITGNIRFVSEKVKQAVSPSNTTSR